MNKDIEYFVKVGICIEKLRNIVTDDVFDNLSKHNPYFDSEYQVEANKLAELRRALVMVKEEVWYIIMQLEPKDDE